MCIIGPSAFNKFGFGFGSFRKFQESLCENCVALNEKST